MTSPFEILLSLTGEARKKKQEERQSFAFESAGAISPTLDYAIGKIREIAELDDIREMKRRLKRLSNYFERQLQEVETKRTSALFDPFTRIWSTPGEI